MNALMHDFQAICEFGGRFAGSESEIAATDWLAARLEQVCGVAPGRVPVDYLGWSRGEAVLERLDGPGGSHECVYPGPFSRDSSARPGGGPDRCRARYRG